MTVSQIPLFWWPLRCDLWGVIVIPLDLRQNVVLERFEFNVSLSILPRMEEWIYWTLQSITSSLFKEFVIWVLTEGYLWGPVNGDGWKAVDALLNTLAERNPNFRVVIKGCFYSFLHGVRGGFEGVRSLVEGSLPLALSNGLVKFECVPRAENRFRKLGVF